MKADLSLAKITDAQRKWLPKDQAKADLANVMIAAPGSVGATGEYSRLWLEAGLPLNPGDYFPSDVVFVSVNGKRKGAKPLYFEELRKAVAGGGQFITDPPRRRPEGGNPYNTGEQQVADYLRSEGYTEKVHPLYSIWKPQ